MIIQGKIKKNKEIQGHAYTIVEFSVDELMKRNTPKVNFWIFCIYNDLLKQWKIENEGDGNYYPTIDLVDLTLSENEDNNKYIIDMLKKFDINVIY